MGRAFSIDQQHQANTTAFGGNIPYRGLEWHSTHDPKYLLYVFNVSPRSFEGVGRIKLRVSGVEESDPSLPGMPESKYHYCTSFPQPILIPRFNDETGEIEMKETDVRRFVIDLISPDNLTLTLDTEIRPENAFSVGNDYAPRGIFFSYTNPPAEEDVKKAVARMEKYFRGLLEKAATLELTDKAKLSLELGSNPDYSYAASYFGKDVTWNRRQTRPSICPNCGEGRPTNAKFHMASDGGLCVEPSVEAWQTVVRIGRRKYEDVPEEFRWKDLATAATVEVEPNPPSVRERLGKKDGI